MATSQTVAGRPGGVAREVAVGFRPRASVARSGVERMAYLDGLKVLLVAVIIAGHGAMGYSDLENAWPYQDVRRSRCRTPWMSCWARWWCRRRCSPWACFSARWACDSRFAGAQGRAPVRPRSRAAPR